MQQVRRSRHRGKTLWDAMIDMYEEFGYYKDAIQAVTMKGIEGLQKIQEIMTTLRQNPPAEFAGHKVTVTTSWMRSQILQQVKCFYYGVDGNMGSCRCRRNSIMALMQMQTRNPMQGCS